MSGKHEVVWSYVAENDLKNIFTINWIAA